MLRSSSLHARSRGTRFPGRRALAALWLGVVGLTSVWTSSSGAGSPDLLVVVNVANPVTRIDRGDLRRIFQTSKKTWSSGDRIEPLNLPEGSSQREQFDRAVLGFSPAETIKFWIDRKVRGDGRPPRKVASASAVIGYVASSSGAIGYVPVGSEAKGVRVVARVSGAEVKSP